MGGGGLGFPLALPAAAGLPPAPGLGTGETLEFLLFPVAGKQNSKEKEEPEVTCEKETWCPAPSSRSEEGDHGRRDAGTSITSLKVSRGRSGTFHLRPLPPAHTVQDSFQTRLTTWVLREAGPAGRGPAARGPSSLRPGSPLPVLPHAFLRSRREALGGPVPAAGLASEPSAEVPGGPSVLEPPLHLLS